jgi:crotonobetainyl-CoA:carnitine CoA-transferase CaiB-like acyl-CoA transferase
VTQAWPLLFAGGRASVIRSCHSKYYDSTLPAREGVPLTCLATPGSSKGGPLWPGPDTKAILAELGYCGDEIARLIASGAVDGTSTSE